MTSDEFRIALAASSRTTRPDAAFIFLAALYSHGGRLTRAALLSPDGGGMLVGRMSPTTLTAVVKQLEAVGILERRHSDAGARFVEYAVVGT